ncbi:MAG: hypothetical protein JWL94_787 [Microbacteriaceae bacterium]|jgi:hypothetical protein|nr:hypothetical protein [Microbacteriaceae bacterium]
MRRERYGSASTNGRCRLRCALRITVGAALLAVSVGVSACDDSTVRLGPSPGASPAAAVVQFCADFTTAGGDSSTVGPLGLSLPKERLSAQISERLTRMGDLEPPQPIAESWSKYKAFFADVRLALANQTEGTALEDDDLIQTGLELYVESRIVRNFILINCE